MQRHERVNSKTTGCKCCSFFSKGNPNYRRYPHRIVRGFYKKQVSKELKEYGK